MKTSKPLYILLLFLIISNIFFLFQFLNQPERKKPKPGEFLTRELNFDSAQMVAYDKLAKPHFKKIKGYSKQIKTLKNELFTKVSEDTTNMKSIDSIAGIIGAIERQKDVEVFTHFKAVKALCNAKQKDAFTEIVLKALHRALPGNTKRTQHK